MNLYLFDDENIITFNLPSKKIGNFWMTDNNQKNLINISGENNNWIITGNTDVKIISNEKSDSIILKQNNSYIIEKNDKKYVLYCDKVNDDTFECYNISDNQVVKIGKAETNDISINIPYFADLQLILSLQSGNYVIQKAKDSLIYCNKKLIKEEQSVLKFGDVINTFGLKIVLIKNALFINAPYKLTLRTKLSKKVIKNEDAITDEEIENKKMYEDSDYFLISPRMRNVVETLNMRIDSPPGRENMQETPLIMTLAPMLTMAASSMLTLSSALQAISSGEKTWKQSTPTLIISGAMIFSMFIWPFVTRAYEKSQKKKRERNRQEKYKEYLNKKSEELQKEFIIQKKTLEETLISTDICYDSIINKRRTLWQRRLDQGDFLNVRIGKGNVPFDANINYQSEEFTMDDDNLKKMLEELINKYKILDNVPLGYSFAKNYLTAVNGVYPKYINFLNNIFLQLMDFHNYHDLKIVVFTNKKNETRWNYLKESPYTFSNDKSIRFFATNTEEMQVISDYLLPRFLNRKEYNNNNNNIDDFSKYASYYLILVDDIDSARKIDLINNVLEEKRNLGYSVIIAEEKLSKIPSEVSKFITVGETVSVVLNSENNNQIRFNDEINNNYDMNLVSKTLLNTPLYLDEKSKGLPNMLTFLEMFSVGQIDQLNVLNRWKDNNPVKSLKAEVGVNENGDLFNIDIHEKAHGPHGLIAGMTGSGKSEFIITYVLSMAINYSPEEVSFVLIDYKGGGLAGAFVNSETGIKLPHVVGTITNLDKAEINRALSSIQSELRRRQEKFNEVRDKLGESTIDIYKYQKLYRDGVINEPIPHLVIICDEFAELKDQQPDFMEDLISTARIGRSLGVHLILATQKPSGVVDAQIWSNARFKVCLKVQDKSDSTEMIKTDDAVEIKNVGRFYLLVGYNEYYALGQAAWAGAPYFPNKEFKKPVDKNLYFIDNVGEINKAINNTTSKRFARSEGEELTNIVKYLIDICGTNYKIKGLWLDRLNSVILLNNLFKKYNYAKESYNINPIIGEFDDPYNQVQGLLTLNIGTYGNAIIYGNAESGKDEFLSTFVYSSIMTYDTNELNLYLIDYGAETLQNFESAPQVGNVILNGDDEKLENLAKMLFSEMNKRKKLFTSFNGNYDDYIKLSGETLPNIVVVINNIEVLSEVNPDYIDKITQIVRDGSKYGINFVITTTGATTVKFKIAQACKQTLCLQMKNESDYRDILGKTDGLVPSNYVGRGLAKLDRVVEFQTASISKESSFNTIKELINTLNEKRINKAKSIPVMPNLIEVNRFASKFEGLNSVPIGITKETLNAYLYDFSKNVVNLISASEFDSMKLFICNFNKVLELNDSIDKVVVDANNYFESFNYKLNYLNNNFNNFVDSLKNIDDKIKDVLTKNNYNLRSISNIKNTLITIIGFDKFLNKLDDEHRKIFKEILNNQKEVLKITFIFIDVVSSFKKYEYEDWYKSCINNTEGIWIGAGVTNQFTIKLSIQPSGINVVDKDYLIAVKNGMPTIVKMINEIKE